MRMLQLLLAAPSSGSGKTTAACALLSALKARGLEPCAFKCGPDYIDPMFHRAVLGVPSHNLDLFFSTPQTVTITVSVSGAYTAQDTFVAKIVDLNEHIPPDPVATDTNPGYSVPPLPNETQKLTANWGVWSCYWVPVWVWCDHGEDGGHWVDEGYWEYEYTGYSASISGEMSLMPDDIVPTASGKTMKSGYGVKTEVRATLSTDAPTSHITYPQTAFSVFPEFQYQTYLRLLQRSGGQSAKFIFKPNEFSTYDRTVHFTPLWFPDATDYTIYTQVWDTWTPDGMLSINLNDYVSIQGSLYDDWYTNRE